ncbi:MAG: hypothetical protein JWM47_2807 [Acidimicrobiales bacterium]|nr:hypothetical protein [Acidimicrobiales bacterium]
MTGPDDDSPGRVLPDDDPPHDDARGDRERDDQGGAGTGGRWDGDPRHDPLGALRDLAGDDPRVQAGLEHLQRAAREVIAASRALLDVADDLVEDPRALGGVVGLLGSVGDLAGRFGRPARPVRSRPGHRDDPGDPGDPDDDWDDDEGDDDPPVQRIPVS